MTLVKTGKPQISTTVKWSKQSQVSLSFYHASAHWHALLI